MLLAPVFLSPTAAEAQDKPEITVSASHTTIVGDGSSEVMFILTWSGMIPSDLGDYTYMLTANGGLRTSFTGPDTVNFPDLSSGRLARTFRTNRLTGSASIVETFTLIAYPWSGYTVASGVPVGNAMHASVTVTVTAPPPEITVTAQEDTVVGDGTNDVVFILNWMGTLSSTEIRYTLPSTDAITHFLEGTGPQTSTFPVLDPASGSYPIRMRTGRLAVGSTSIDVTFTVLDNPPNYMAGDPASATVTVTAPPPEVTVAANTGGESVVGGNDAVFTLTRTGDTTDALPVSFAISGTHSVTSPPTSPVNIPAGMTTVDVSVPTTPITGMNQTVILTVEDPDDDSYTVPTGTGSMATVTVTAPADMTPSLVITVVAEAAEITEGETARCRYDYSGPTPPARVNVRHTQVGDFVTRSEALATTSYTEAEFLVAGFLSIGFGTTDDNRLEADGSVTCEVLAGDGYTVGASSRVTITIRDNDGGTPEPTLMSAMVDGPTLILTYDEALDGDSVPANSAFSVHLNSEDMGVDSPVNTVAVEGMTVTLTLDVAVGSTDMVTVSYMPLMQPSMDPIMNPIQDGDGNAARRLVGQRVVNNTPPSPPTGVMTTADTAGELAVSWTAPDPAPAGGYHVQYSTDGGSNWEPDPAQAVAMGTTTHTFTSLAAGMYGARVRAVYGAGDTSDWVETPSPVTVTSTNSEPVGVPVVGGILRVGQSAAAGTDPVSDPDGPASLTFTGYQWWRADNDMGMGAMEISGEDQFAYLLVPADAGKYLRVVVTYTDAGGTEENVASDWTAVENSDPMGMPSIGGTLMVTQEAMAVTTGVSDPDGPATLSFTGYQWRRADDDMGAAEEDIGSATSSSYTLTTDDAGKYLQVVVTYTDGGGTEEDVASAWTAVENSMAMGMPEIMGTPRVDEVLTAGLGDVTDADGIVESTIGYAWLRVDTAGMQLEQLGTGTTYTLVQEDVGHKIRLAVSFEDNGDDTPRRTSDPWPASGTVMRRANTPAMGDLVFTSSTGVVQVDALLTADVTDITDPVDGLTGTPDYSYQWWRANDASGMGGVWINPPSASQAATYTPTKDGDQGKFIRVSVSFFDDDNHLEMKESPWQEVLRRADTAASGDVTIDGASAAQVGVELTAVTTGIMDTTNGLNTPDWRYQWRRADDTSDTNGADIATATTATYTPLAAADQGKVLRVTVTFTDDDDYEGTKTSNWTSAVAAGAADTTPPMLETAEINGNTLVLTFDEALDETSTPVNRDFSIAVAASPANVNAVVISGSTVTLTLDTTVNHGDAVTVGYLIGTMPLRDTSGNQAISFTSRSVTNSTPAASTNADPVGTPSITGTLRVGQDAMAVTTGITDADGPATLSFTGYQWRRADDDTGTDEEDIGSATSSSYTLTTDDAGKYLQVVVTYTDGGGTEEDVASAWTEVENSPPTGGPVALLGVAQVGGNLATLTGGIADADGPATPEFSFKWQRTDDPAGSNFEDIADTNRSSYSPVAADLGKHLRVVVSYTDGGGTMETLESAWSAAVTARPNAEAMGEPAIEVAGVAGTARVGLELTATRGTITDADGVPAESTFSYQWQRRGPFGWSNIGTDSNTYTPVSYDDPGKTLRVRVTFTDDGGTEETRTSDEITVFGTPATGKPEIMGTAQVGEELTATRGDIADVDGLPPAAQDMYQWQRETSANTWENIGTNSNTYTLLDADAGLRVRVRLSFTDPSFTIEMRTSDPWPASGTVAARPNAAPVGGPPTISGTLRVGQDAMAVTTGITDADGPATLSFNYQWRRADDAAGANNAMDIGSETASNTYTLTTDDAGKYLQVVVTYTDSRGTDERLESAWAEVLNSAPVGLPTVSGTLTVGGTATAVTSGISDPDGPATLTFTYQWRRADDASGGGEADIGSATSSTYEIASGDVDKYLQVVVRYTDGGETMERLESTWVAVGNSVPEGMPSITGTLRVGQELTAVTTGISDADGPATLTFTYQWRRADDASGGGEADIDSATSSTYTLSTDDAGKFIQVVASFTDSGSTMENVPSAWQEVLNSAPTGGPPTISGTLRVTQELTAMTTGISDADGPAVLSFRYQWRRADDASGGGAMDIGSATSSNTYTLAEADAGKFIQVVVAYSDGGETMERLESAWTQVLNSDPVGLPTISGTLTVGDDVTAVTDGISDADGPAVLTFSGYQWWSADDASGGGAAELSGANAAIYTLDTADEDKHLRVVVTYTDGGNTMESVQSDWTATAVMAATAPDPDPDPDPDPAPDPDPMPTLPEITVAVQTGGESVVGGSAGPAVFTLTRTEPTAAALTVGIALTGTHSVTSPPTSAVFAAGMATALVSITTSAITGADETVTLTIEPGDGSTYTVGTPGMATVTVAAPPLSEVTVAVQTGGARVIGGSAGPAVFTLTRTEPTTDALTVGIALTGTHAVTSPPTSAVFAAGMATALVSVPTSEITGAEQTVTLTIEPGDGSTYTVGTPGTATVNVAAPPLSEVTVAVRTGGERVAGGSANPAVFTLTRTEPTADALTVGIALTGTHAVTSPPTSAVFAAGMTTVDVSVPTSAITGADQTVTLTIEPGDGSTYTVGTPGTATVAVIDPALKASEIVETTEQSLALLAPTLAANTVQVLTARFENIAAGAPGAATLGGRPLGAFSGAGVSASGAELTREVAALFGLHLPAPGAAAAQADAPVAHASATEMPGGQGAFEAQGGSARILDAHGTAAHVGRGRGAGHAGNTGGRRAFDTNSLNSPELRRLLAQSSFSVRLGAAHGAHGAAEGGSHWTLWGRGAAGGFEGTEKESALAVEGESVSAYLGADRQRGDLALGLALGWSSGELDYANTADNASGELETELTSVHPYLHWTVRDDTSLYAMLGYGSGETTLDDAGLTASLTSDLEMQMLAVGARRAISGTGAGLRSEVKLDAFWVDIESDGAKATQDGVTWAPVNSQASRMRVALAGALPLQQGLLAEGELAVRLDGGDAQTGIGAELGAGLGWSTGGFSLAARGRVLLVHSEGAFEDYEEWGASLEASYRPGAAGRGLRFTLSPAWGEVQSGVDALYESSGALRELGGEDAQRSERRSGGLPDRLDFELGYGLAALGGRAELLPFGRFSLAGGSASETRLRFGTRLDLPHRAGDALPVHRLGLEVFGETRAGEARDRRVGLELRLGF